MASKKYRNISLAMEPSLQEAVRQYAEKKGVSISSAIKELVQKYLVTEESSVKIVLSIPSDYTQDPERLDQWLTAKKNAILNHFKNGSH